MADSQVKMYSNILHQSVLDYALEQELMADSHVEVDHIPPACPVLWWEFQFFCNGHGSVMNFLNFIAAKRGSTLRRILERRILDAKF